MSEYDGRVKNFQFYAATLVEMFQKIQKVLNAIA